MKHLQAQVGVTRVGLAYGPAVPDFVAAEPGLVDYIEIPFEQLRHAPQLSSLQDTTPLLLHCASLSMAGFVAPGAATVDAVAQQATRLRSPWIGEHLAFTSAEALEDSASAKPTMLTYTVCPQLSESTVTRVIENLGAMRSQIDVPLILENSPQYFPVPGSTMSMVDFIAAIAARCDVGWLLDLTHFLITCLNMGFDPVTELERLPLERVVEVHISGISSQAGLFWDDHARPAAPFVFTLLEHVRRRVQPMAVTIEYNWSPHFARSVLVEQLVRVRELVGAA